MGNYLLFRCEGGGYIKLMHLQAANLPKAGTLFIEGRPLAHVGDTGFVNTKGTGILHKTIASRTKELLAILTPEINIKYINREMIITYFNNLKQAGNKPRTINAKMSYLSKVLNYAGQNNLIDFKPVIPYIKVKTKKQKFINETELNQMINYALNNNLIELYQVIVIGYNSYVLVIYSCI